MAKLTVRYNHRNRKYHFVLEGPKELGVDAWTKSKDGLIPIAVNYYLKAMDASLRKEDPIPFEKIELTIEGLATGDSEEDFVERLTPSKLVGFLEKQLSKVRKIGLPEVVYGGVNS
ncbi:MAG: hypothetical protein ABIE22_05555 [archaeon]